MGHASLHAEATESEEVTDTYTVIAYSARTLPDQYRNMIYAKWLRSLRFGNDYFKLIDSDDYYLTYHRYITNLMQQPSATVRLAVLSDDRDVVLGFAVTRGNILDYVHVHKDHRKCKIGTHLIPCGIDTITHLTRTAMAIWGSKYSNWKFNPFL
jgi:hypothetical protein